jgi:hypothetical protein
MNITPELAELNFRTSAFPVEITTAEELRLLEQEERRQAEELSRFDEFDPIRAHGLGVDLS